MSEVARNLMAKMGWTEGDGLGKNGQGLKTALKPAKKMDQSGIGAVKSNTRWVEASAGYDAILAKLNIAYANGSNSVVVDEGKKKKKDKKEKKDKKGKKRKDTDNQNASSRHLIYAKRLKAKQVQGYSAEDKHMIFGGDLREAKKAKQISLPNTPPHVTSNVMMGTVVASDGEQEIKPTTTVDYVAGQGFTEDTQAQIYQLALDTQIKGRKGLGQGSGNKLSKSARKAQAIRDAGLLREGSYLARKFVYAGEVSDFDLKKLRKAKEEARLALQEELENEQPDFFGMRIGAALSKHSRKRKKITFSSDDEEEEQETDNTSKVKAEKKDKSKKKHKKSKTTEDKSETMKKDKKDKKSKKQGKKDKKTKKVKKDK